jgi:hypothetical protein
MRERIKGMEGIKEIGDDFIAVILFRKMGSKR